MTSGPPPQPGVPNPRQLGATARWLAEEHLRTTSPQAARRSLIPLLTTAGTNLADAYDTFARSAAAGADLTTGAHWILDNFYVLRDQRTEVLRHLRGRFFQELPALASGPLAGYPRVYHVVKHLLEAVDNSVDAETLTRFLNAYQSVCPLTLGELWAVPDALRIALLDHLQELATGVCAAHHDRQKASEWADRIRLAAGSDPVEGTWEARAMVEERSPLPESFVLALVERLQGDPNTRSVVEWLERRLASRSISLQDVARLETQRQVSVAHAVATLRWTADARWGRIVGAVSITERVLRRDPAGVYAGMDFDTRDRYRHTVEDLARYSGAKEVDVAEAAVARGASAKEESANSDAAHVGYHLIGPGAHAFERSLGFRAPLRRQLARLAYRRPKMIYLGIVAGVTALSELGILWVAEGRGVSITLLVLVLLAALLPCVDLAVAFSNRLVAWIVPPRPLPKMHREAGLDPTNRTLVVVPTLLRSPEDARAQVEALEIHARANPSPILRFALLTDLPDSAEATEPGDEEILGAARAAIRALNQRERDEWGDRFFLLHRDRRWNEAEGVWMGWERKRGKLEELNLLLRDPDAPTTYTLFEGDFLGVTADRQIRFVICLDADTRMPPDTAVDLIRTAAHPLNRPVYDPLKKRVTRGYGILQPRVSISPRSASRSWFARVFSGHVGLDPYTTAVSDAYQDLFREGIYTGKGLYDVDAFEAALNGVVPPNTVLSHDLLESTFARAALVTDIEVYDDYPRGFMSYAKRQHRWVRGDWQIVRWLLPYYRDADGLRRRNPITVLGRWQILDNIRRSLTGPAMLLFLLAGWVALPRSPVFWTGVALAIIAFPVYVNLTAAVFSRPKDATWLSYFRGVRRDLRLNLVQTGLTIALLAHTALFNVDAIARAFWRMFISRRLMLEWATASDVELSDSGTLKDYWRFMWPSVLWAGTSFILVTWVEPWAWIAAGPFVAVWVAAPWIAWRLAAPVQRVREELTPGDRLWLRRVGRRTWSYFERHVGPQTLWLPPDNVQENPYRGAAPRTSPTNLGLTLLATQSAFDFGWIGHDQLLDRLSAAAESIDRLEKYCGHLFNWYDIRFGHTLWPRYVSTVDSGNFVASLIVLEQALRDRGAELWPNPQLAEGLRDTIGLVREQLGGPASGDVQDPLLETLERLEELGARASAGSLGAWLEALAEARAIMGSIEGVHRPTTTALPSASVPASEELESGRNTLRILDEFLEGQAAELGGVLPWWAGGEPLPPELERVRSLAGLRAALSTIESVDERATEALEALRRRDRRRADLGAWCLVRIRETDFSILYDRRRELFAVGFDVDNLQLDASYYDLLASEARLASYIAIAGGEVPPTHWFRLGRRATEVEGGSVLLSWGGTMFEYLMPLLFTATWSGTLLDESYVSAVLAQKRYGARQQRPWGISESAYNTLNLELDYQYRAFGVPGLGLQRGLGKDYVVAPYASALALMVMPESATANLRALESEGAYGAHGFYDAVDYTPSRVPPGGERAVVVQNWMAHHQGMVLLSLANVLDDHRVQRRFHASPLVKAAELLIQERVPLRIRTVDPHPMEASIDPGERRQDAPPVAHVPAERLGDPSPRGHLLSNGRYSVLLTQAGTGYSRFRNWQLTRWTADRICDPYGTFFYLRDLDTGRFWSATPNPVGVKGDRLDTWFHLSKVEAALVHDWIETFVEVCVSPEDDVEIRRLTITNYGAEKRRLDVTSYVEVVLNEVGADRAHPAFSKLFVETEHVREHSALLATRRPRQNDAERLWMFHTIAQDTQGSGPLSSLEFETDRARFVGRRRTLTNPQALDRDARLSGTVGPVLDPILSLRQPIVLEPQEKVVISFALGVAATREEAVSLADRYDNPTAAQRVIDLATAYGPVETEHLAISGAEALRLQELGTAIQYSDPRLRAPAEILARNRKQQSGLWGYGISGDLPLVAVRVRSTDQMDEVGEAIKAFEYWRLKGLDTDLVFLNEHPPSYVEGLHDLITEAIHAPSLRSAAGHRGRIHVLRADQLPDEDLDLILTVASAVFDSGLLTLSSSADGATPVWKPLPPLEAGPPVQWDRVPERSDPSGLLFDNGFGGYTPDGSYQIRAGQDGNAEATPAPWINVVANPLIGFTASEGGGGFSWTLNSHENRLTPWSNDPVGDKPSEILYVRDEASGLFGSVTPSPAPLPGRYDTRHSFGRTTFCHQGAGLEQELTLFAAEADPVKVYHLRIRNTAAQRRELSVFYYHDWVLGVQREDAARYVVTGRDVETGALLARSHYNEDFAGRVAFVQAITPNGAHPEATADRAAFLGRGRDVSRPRAVEERVSLDERVGAGLDPCAAWRVPLVLEAGEEQHVVFLLGEDEDVEAVRILLARFDTVEKVLAELEAVSEVWRRRLGMIEVSTPSPIIDRALDGWLLYQTLACRVWGRSALYQSGGAFGFRDQLQDAMALVYVDPAIARKQILLHAAHQFIEGDVLHWWHPPTGRGVRTRFSDDLLWLPLVTAFYIGSTGDAAVLQERVRYLTARSLEPDEQEAYLHPERSRERGDLYDHCCRALDRSLLVGAHGLPLMGAGDWNDGMSRVGLDGGESVWLGFFLHSILGDFIPLCEARGDAERVERYASHRTDLGVALNASGWDGEWYRRAYYGDGSPLGSHENQECRIDAIAQAWSVISGVAPPERAASALASVDRHLVDRDGRLVRLLTPPFDESERDPGYIKGYLPGVRENGGQYTHGVSWVIQAFAEMGDVDRARDIFEMIAPLNHTRTPQEVERYKVEPYIAAADVYSVAPHVGRGGWTWYTGSAGWIMRVALESILGFTLVSGDIRLEPHMPSDWPGFRLTYRPTPDTSYEIEVERQAGSDSTAIVSATLDGADLAHVSGCILIPVVPDGGAHRVLVKVGG